MTHDTHHNLPAALTIAGSEATGGAGAQADLRTFQALGTFGVAALTCIVSFDPKNNWNHRLFTIDPDVLRDQLEAEFATHTFGAIKTGMLGTPALIEATANVLQQQQVSNLVVDPVLICKGQEPGAALDTDNALKQHILPKAAFITPNHFEAAALSGMESIATEQELIEAAQRIHDAFGATVMAKGGVRLEGPEAIDVFYDGSTLEVLREPKVGEHAVSGAGCSLAAAVTAQLAQGATHLEAARVAKKFVTQGIQQRMIVGTPFDVLRQTNR
ncbi:hydroxymethylpyrimidine/phosphomethylpyrimidine kinase [Dermatophilus congolensis]|uniref:pyridoxal kinase n=1 Tax=Dermatophilus congolensis TaxID=1863 RepID=A0A239V878_9MICO|nr:hydroxymethylpyrimidine/phosphomethylpyrimidine kinase [Dermatophilus congolensis]MBO3130296.1 hydroxymethylpyrimidine/phosphomethylpyrimidine kinase [Dermatophilus congolensis]MBO3131073.1 hydroxymethylpyrimidine/phosphomethylpyrimidine kinase [Dermatophilus congolensis]MBO3134767.1 hydroxymethylpyrimidine/phosphomethylpyrimidine kinase [Dermatophilus congolensis]MBO3137003.1 hydroxymethylpyrimidine/phosphomethylpyrimidine kinase [Dermatophilus congolensis]MBO3139248.1 hydroxymethylpyrimid